MWIIRNRGLVVASIDDRDILGYVGPRFAEPMRFETKEIAEKCWNDHCPTLPYCGEKGITAEEEQ